MLGIEPRGPKPVFRAHSRIFDAQEHNTEYTNDVGQRYDLDFVVEMESTAVIV